MLAERLVEADDFPSLTFDFLSFEPPSWRASLEGGDREWGLTINDKT
jgi:hypothetical protein